MEKLLEVLFEPYYKQSKGGLDEWVDYADAIKVAEDYSLKKNSQLLKENEQLKSIIDEQAKTIARLEIEILCLKRE
jgi:hypothetical protein